MCRSGIKCFRCNNFGHKGNQCSEVFEKGNMSVTWHPRGSSACARDGAIDQSLVRRTTSGNRTGPSNCYDSQTSNDYKEIKEVMQIENKQDFTTTKPMTMVKIKDLDVT